MPSTVESFGTNQLVLRTLLTQIGIEATIVDTGAEALAAWEIGDYDLVLMDIQMPQMDGPTAARAIRAREIETGRARTPIVALTANVMKHQLDAYAEAGMDGVVAKPIAVAELYAAIAERLAGPRTSGETPADREPVDLAVAHHMPGRRRGEVRPDHQHL